MTSVSRKTRNIPLYNVIVYGLDEASGYDMPMSQAKTYATFIDDMCPYIEWSRSVDLFTYHEMFHPESCQCASAQP